MSKNVLRFQIESDTENEEEETLSRISVQLKKEQEMTHISEGNTLNIESDEIMSVNTNENDENVFSSTSNYGTSGESIKPDNNENIGQKKHGVHPKKPLKRCPSTPYLEDKLRRKLKFYFMGPHEKIIARRKCPWKLLLQIAKVVLVTVQLCLFGYERSSFMEYVEKNNIALKHLYLEKWDPSYETMPYPPATGPYAIYTKDELHQHINFAMRQYNQTEEVALAVFQLIRTNNGTVQPMELCSEHYSGGTLYQNGSFTIYSEKYNDCVPVYPVEEVNKTTGEIYFNYDIVKYMQQLNKTEIFHRIIKLTLKFKLRSYRLNAEEIKVVPACFLVHGKIVFDDSNRDGQMLLDLRTELEERTCHGQFSYGESENLERLLYTIFDIIVVCISVLSSILCLRSLYRGHKLLKTTIKHFKDRYWKELSWSDQFEFINLWYVVIVINDIITVIGSAFKIQIDNKNAQSTSDNYDNCSLFLGTGSILVWLGVLRYLGFFKTFNILSLVLKKAFPNMIRFLVGALMLYVGFMFCGWVVLGPYHVKFKSLSTSSECLYSLINGDDMFVTFSATMSKNMVVWYFSRIYLYIFISLFIYAVLNLFTGVILDTYETIKEYYEHGFPKTCLFEFIDACHDPPTSALYKGEDRGCGILSCLCCFKRNKDRPGEYTSLLR